MLGVGRSQKRITRLVLIRLEVYQAEHGRKPEEHLSRNNDETVKQQSSNNITQIQRPRKARPQVF